MSTPKIRGTTRPTEANPPLIGALLRLPHEAVMAHISETLHAQGFDLTRSELELFRYPGPDGQRPADLARQCNMTRQAMNYVLLGLEGRGYVERHLGNVSTVRVVKLTDKGQAVFAEIRNCVAGIEKQWAAHLGKQRFKELKETLRELSEWLAAKN